MPRHKRQFEEKDDRDYIAARNDLESSAFERAETEDGQFKHHVFTDLQSIPRSPNGQPRAHPLTPPVFLRTSTNKSFGGANVGARRLSPLPDSPT